MPGYTRACTDTQGSNPSHATTFAFTKHTHFRYSFWQLNAASGDERSLEATAPAFKAWRVY